MSTSKRDEPTPQLSPPELVPVRMLSDHAYCPRLAYLEWVQGDSADPAERAAARAPAETDAPPVLAEHGAAPLHARTVQLSAPQLGLTARIDLIEPAGEEVTPIDYKRGRAPELPEGAGEPELVQLCAQALILEEHGYRVARGALHFVEASRRVDVELDAALRARTLELLAQLRADAVRDVPPPPLIDSPKCPGCPLVAICLPDEVNLLRATAMRPAADPEAESTEAESTDAERAAAERAEAEGAEAEGAETEDEPRGPRRLIPGRDDALPLYVQSAGARVSKRGEELVIELPDGTAQTTRLENTSHVALFWGVQISTQALQDLCARGITVSHLSSGGWLDGITRGMEHKNVELRRRQFAAAADPERCLSLARRFVRVKIRNCRTLVRRNALAVREQVIERLRERVDAAGAATTLEALRGVEGAAARLYYEAYGSMLRPPGAGGRWSFDFEGRHYRPARDPVNALLSFGYALLVKDVVVTLLAVGFDPYMGFHHQPRYGRPALALDVMEEFRPLIVDSVVLGAVNTGAVNGADFIRRGGVVALAPSGRTAFMRAYERRMDELVSHPVFGYRISYRRVLEVQARLLARYLAGEIAEYPPFATR
jgi:CRISP-associated protein Cas1